MNYSIIPHTQKKNPKKKIELNGNGNWTSIERKMETCEAWYIWKRWRQSSDTAYWTNAHGLFALIFPAASSKSRPSRTTQVSKSTYSLTYNSSLFLPLSLSLSLCLKNFFILLLIFFFFFLLVVLVFVAVVVSFSSIPCFFLFRYLLFTACLLCYACLLVLYFSLLVVMVRFFSSGIFRIVLFVCLFFSAFFCVF